MYRVNNRADELEILMYDDIGEGWFGGISAKQVVDDIAGSSAPTIRARINSPGGDVFDGFAIYNALRQADARVIVDIDALAASAASVIAMAGDEIRMAENAMMMIHNAWTVAAGDSNEFERLTALLRQINGNVAKAYVNQTGLEESTILDMMNVETWMTADEAEGMGFITSITSDQKVAAAAFDPKRFRNTPERFKASEPERKDKSPEWKRQANARALKLAGLT